MDWRVRLIYRPTILPGPHCHPETPLGRRITDQCYCIPIEWIMGKTPLVRITARR